MNLHIRLFQAKDAEFCFRIRNNAFRQIFYGELTAQEVAAAVDAYMPDDYIVMAKESPLFIVAEDGNAIGFFALKRENTSTAELSLIYIDLDHQGKGVGLACIDYIENWLASNWAEVKSLIVDTIIPMYNRKFYLKVGFIPVGETFCKFGRQKIKALRLVKKLKA